MVDDDEGFLDVLEYGFAEAKTSVRITKTSSPEKALKYIESGEADIVISDYSMPSLTGLDLLEQIRSKALSTPFILLSNVRREELALTALDRGADYYIQKSHDVHGMVSELSNFVQKEMEKKRDNIRFQQTERSLFRTERLYQTIFENSFNGIMILQDGYIVEANQFLADFLECSRDQMIGRSVPSIVGEFCSISSVSSEDYNRLLAMAREEPQKLQWSIVRADGTRKTAKVIVSNVDLPNEQVVQIVVHDISDLKNTELSMEHALKILSRTFFALSDKIIVVNKQKEVVFTNITYPNHSPTDPCSKYFNDPTHCQDCLVEEVFRTKERKEMCLEKGMKVKFFPILGASNEVALVVEQITE